MTELHVICKIAGAEYALPASEVYQMDTYSGSTKVPGAPSYVEGLVQVRQQVVPVINTRRRFDLPDAAPTSESRLVVLRQGNRLVSLLVDSAREVMNIDTELFGNTEAMGNQTKGFVKAAAQIKGRIILLLDALKVVGDEKTNG